MAQQGGNIDFTRDEVVVLYDAYREILQRTSSFSKTDPAVQLLSETFRGLGIHPGAEQDPRFRSAEGIAGRLRTIHRVHEGILNKQKLLLLNEVVAVYRDDPVGLSRDAAAILSRNCVRYWWVNQNKTFKHEYEGGYLWSPKRSKGDRRNPFYDFMLGVQPGDVIFSFAGTVIPAISIAQSTAYEFPKPVEFGNTGQNWEKVGWKVTLRYFPLANAIRPADHMDVLAPLLPDKYSPLQASGRGKEFYLTTVPESLAQALIGLIGAEAKELVGVNRVADSPFEQPDQATRDLDEWEDRVADAIQEDGTLDSTEKKALVKARRGQGLFKKNVRMIESRCRITKVDRIQHLIASHCKPWRDCETNSERLDGENGLLLTPTMDHLFDRGYISFEGQGKLLVSPVAHKESMVRMGIDPGVRVDVGAFSEGQRNYLEYHRNQVFLEARK